MFASGVVLWEPLTGRALFRGESEAETIWLVLSKTIEPPSAHNPAVWRELDEACLRALERAPAAQFNLHFARGEEARAFA